MILLLLIAAAAAKSLQSCLTLCDPIDGSPPDSPIPGILQARTLEWVAISFSNAWKWEGKVKSLSRVRLFATAWTAAHQAPPSMGFSRLVLPLSVYPGSNLYVPLHQGPVTKRLPTRLNQKEASAEQRVGGDNARMHWFLMLNPQMGLCRWH